MPQPLAIWNSARDVWETPGTEGLFCEHLDVYSETFPTSGMTLNGVAYELPTWEPVTSDLGFSSSPTMLPTPVAQPSGNTPENHLRKKPGRTIVTDLAILVENDLLKSRGRLLPTPSACVANDGESTETWLARRERVKLTAANGNGMGMPLTVASLLIQEAQLPGQTSALDHLEG